MTRLHPDEHRLRRVAGFDLAKLGPLLPRYRATLAEVVAENPGWASLVNGILYPVIQPKEFQSSVTLKSELRALRGYPGTDVRKGLAELAADAGDGVRGAGSNRLFQEAVVSFVEEDFLRTEATVKPEAVEPFLNLIADDARVFELRLGLLRLAPDHVSLVEAAAEAARVARSLTVLEGALAGEYRLAPTGARLHDADARASALLRAMADADARLSGGRREAGALQEMLLGLALRSFERGNRDAKFLIRTLVDVVENAGSAAAAPMLERFARSLAASGRTEVVFGMEARHRLEHLILSLRGTAGSCHRTFTK